MRQGCLLRRVKYLNNVIEQDHRCIKRKVRASQCFKRFHTAERTLEGIGVMNTSRKGQVKRLAGNDVQGQAQFVASPFAVAALRKALEEFSRLKTIFATQPIEAAYDSYAQLIVVNIFLATLPPTAELQKIF